jgi:DNA invertase Pin-like site-specific DNA recombinase
MIGVLAELERSLIIERTRAGVRAAQQRGVTEQAGKQCVILQAA